MKYAIEINNLVKKYPSFTLDNVSFKVEEGSVMGFIGRNGAGKTTTLKCMFNLVHPTSGNVSVLEMDPMVDDIKIKQEVGFLLGGVNYYLKTKIKKITKVTSSFYKSWDNELYNKYLKLFELDENKKIGELSQGMKVKYGLLLALSHNAKVLVLDEPTSGLDPISRDEILEIFNFLSKKEKVTILFSTHITSDLERIATHITYIKNGTIIDSCSYKDFKKDYLYFEGNKEKLTELLKNKTISWRDEIGKVEGLINREDAEEFKKYFAVSEPTIDTIIIFKERGHENEKFAL